MPPCACFFPSAFSPPLCQTFWVEDGSSFSSLIMPNSTPICHVYSAGTKQRGEPRLCPLPLAPLPLPKPRPIILPPRSSTHAREANGRARFCAEKYSFSFRLYRRCYLRSPFIYRTSRSVTTLLMEQLYFMPVWYCFMVKQVFKINYSHFSSRIDCRNYAIMENAGSIFFLLCTA